MGAQLYADPQDRLVVKIECEPSLPEPYDTVQRIEDGYSNEKHIYLSTPDYEDMEPTGNLSSRTADVEPTHGPQSKIEMPNKREARCELAIPSNLPAVSSPNKIPSEPSQSNGLPPHISPAQEPAYQLSISALKVMVNQKNIVLYREETGTFYSPVDSSSQNSNHTMLTFITTADYTTLSITDNWDRKYRVVPVDELETYTWKGIPVYHDPEYAVDYETTYVANTSRETQDPPVALARDAHSEQDSVTENLDEALQTQSSAEPVGSPKPSTPPSELETPSESETRAQTREANPALEPWTLHTKDYPNDISVGKGNIEAESTNEANEVLRPPTLQPTNTPTAKPEGNQKKIDPPRMEIYYDWDLKRWREREPVHVQNERREPVSLPNESPIEQVIPYEPLRERWPEPLKPAEVIKVATELPKEVPVESTKAEENPQTERLKVEIPVAESSNVSKWDALNEQDRPKNKMKETSPTTTPKAGAKESKPTQKVLEPKKEVIKPQLQQKQQQSGAADKGTAKVDNPTATKELLHYRAKANSTSPQPEVMQMEKEVKHISSSSSVKSNTPGLTVGLESSGNLQRASLNPQAKNNVLSLALYNRLAEKAGTSSGVANVLLHINGVSERHPFKVVDYQEQEQLILGRPWICGHQCLLDFAKLRVCFSIGANHFNMPMMEGAQQQEQQSTQPTKKRRDRRNKGKGRTSNPTPQPNPLPKQLPRPKDVQPVAPKATQIAPDYSRSNREIWLPKAKLEALKANQQEHNYSRSNTVIWLPRQKPSTASTSLPPTVIPKQPKSTSKSTRQKPSRKWKTNRFEGFPTMQIWVPKTSLQMQGYYDGNAYIWLPKEEL